MALVGKTDGYAVYVKQFEWKKIWIEPNMSSNGTWMADGYSCRGSGLDSLNNLYQVFNGTYTSYLNKFNGNTWIEICLPQATEVAGCYMSSSDGYFPATGDIYYSDDGDTYTKCGSWADTSNSKNVTAYVTKGSGAHRIWRFMSTGRASAHTSSNADVSVAKLFTEVKEYLSVDNTLPEGVGGITHAYATYNEHKGLDIRRIEPHALYRPHDGLAVRKLEVYFTYKQDDKVNLKEGEDELPAIKGLLEAFITASPHDGLAIRKSDAYITYRQDDKVDFNIPYGAGGIVHTYVLNRLHDKTMMGGLNDIAIEDVQGIALGGDYYALKKIKSFNNIPLYNG